MLWIQSVILFSTSPWYRWVHVLCCWLLSKFMEKPVSVSVEASNTATIEFSQYLSLLGVILSYRVFTVSTEWGFAYNCFKETKECCMHVEWVSGHLISPWLWSIVVCTYSTSGGHVREQIGAWEPGDGLPTKGVELLNRWGNLSFPLSDPLKNLYKLPG